MIQAPQSEAEGPARSPTAWRGITAILAFTFWLPLSMLAGAAGRTLLRSQLDPADPAVLAQASSATRALAALSLALPALASFVLACGLAGALLGRFASGTGARDAGVGGVGAALLATGVAALGGAFPSLLLGTLVFGLMAAVGFAAAALGARLGRRSSRGVDPRGVSH